MGRFRDPLLVLAVAIAVAIVSLSVRARSESATAAARRTADGKPDLTGIWQTLNTANWDLRTHAARPSLAVVPGPAGDVPAAAALALGAIGGVPGGLGVVEGGEIPYRPEALAKRQEN